MGVKPENADPRVAYEKLHLLAVRVEAIIGTSAPWNIDKFQNRMTRGGTLADFLDLFFDTHDYLITTKLYQFGLQSRLQNLLYTICVPFHEGRGAGIFPVWITNLSKKDFWTRLSFYYMSRSHGVWRILPNMIMDWYDKGEHGQYSLTAPWELQLTLDAVYSAMEAKHAELGTRFPQFSARLFTINASEYDVRAAVQKTMAIDADSDSYVMTEQSIEQVPLFEDYRSRIALKDALRDASGLKAKKRPDVLNPHNLISPDASWVIYGMLRRALVYSKDHSTRYLFNLTPDGVFLGGAELVGSPLSNYGVRAKHPARLPVSLFTPLFEYPKEVPVGCSRGESRAKYVKVEGFHDQVMPLLLGEEGYALLKNQAPTKEEARARMQELDRRLRTRNKGQSPSGQPNRLVR